MIEKMVRTQVYLPQAVYAQLQKRAKTHGLTLAVQIREALESYLRRANGVAEDEIEPLDLGNLFEIIGKYGGSGLGDAAENHDQYIYGDPHGEKALEQDRLRAQLKHPPVIAVQERQAVYRAKKRPIAKRKGSRR